MSKTILGFNGVARSGKDTIGKFLVENYGFNRVAFADGVREALYALDPIIDCNSDYGYTRLGEYVDANGWEAAKEIPEVRQLLQRMGTEVGRRMFGEDCWVRLAKRKIDKLDKVVITDVRFENELDFVQSNGGYVFQVFRPGFDSINNHISDVMLCSEVTDGAIYNDGSIEDLKYNIAELLAEYSI
jgi:hypothetical protein